MYQLHPHQRTLVNQARQELIKGNKSALIVSPAGSGKSIIIGEIARLATKKNGHVMFLVHRKELVEQITETFKDSGVDLSQTTIMTVTRIKNRLGRLPKPTLIITDETHHSLAKTYQEIYDYYSDVVKLGFTATPWRLSGQGFESTYDVMVEGPQVQWLIDNHYLADFDYYAPKLLDTSQLKKSSNGDYSNQSIEKSLERKAFGDCVSHYQRLANGQQAILYAHNVETSEKLADEFNMNNIPAAHADAKTPKAKREQIMADFKTGKITVLCNVDLISEGFNVPDCGVVILMRPTASLVVYIQQSMRGMRYKPGKRSLIIDHVGNVERFSPPNAERNWSLKGREKRKGKQREPELDKYTTCEVCSAVFNKEENTTCPICGHEIETENESELKIDRNAELEKVDTQNFQMKTNYVITKKPEELTTVEELKTYAKAKGYKPGWIYFQQKQRGWL
ncbi:MAG: DEAD/DEAH box helicase [Tetragenococcus koreensis]|nr:DEAD/DEAH box helicase [Tetragenococcus koreensis]MDN6733559.1 DEAD/DEAH box helicase [Tetragenococcus koreensis]MDN6736053.1 DEAD/DEAH box helicase [Tetragenococcus koreensis]